MNTADHGRTTHGVPESLADRQVRAHVQARIERAARLILFLDFDGTLAPIVDEPILAILPAATRQVLVELISDPAIMIAIVSGRALGDVKGRVGIPGLIYAGNHGLEIEGQGLSFEHAAAVVLKGAIREITERIATHAAELEGVEIESKVLTSSIHFRRAPRAAQIHLDSLIRDLISPTDPNIEVREAKMVHEIRPRVAWDKGNGVAWIRQQLREEQAQPIVIGDDLTDESAFLAFDDAITICVDPGRPTAAGYELDSPEAVLDFLRWIAQMWSLVHQK
jgi:trehalose 6-phosphate phosphatase